MFINPPNESVTESPQSFLNTHFVMWHTKLRMHPLHFLFLSICTSYLVSKLMMQSEWKPSRHGLVFRERIYLSDRTVSGPAREWKTTISKLTKQLWDQSTHLWSACILGRVTRQKSQMQIEEVFSHNFKCYVWKNQAASFKPRHTQFLLFFMY